MSDSQDTGRPALKLVLFVIVFMTLIGGILVARDYASQYRLGLTSHFSAFSGPIFRGRGGGTIEFNLSDIAGIAVSVAAIILGFIGLFETRVRSSEVVEKSRRNPRIYILYGLVVYFGGIAVMFL